MEQNSEGNNRLNSAWNNVKSDDVDNLFGTNAARFFVPDFPAKTCPAKAIFPFLPPAEQGQIKDIVNKNLHWFCVDKFRL